MSLNSSMGEWADKRLYGAPVAVIDFETTGLSASDCRVIQVGIVHGNLGMGEPVVAYSGHINPGCLIPEDSIRIHGITNEDVRDAPSFEEASADILRHLEGRVLCAYNLPFDFKFLNAELERCGCDPLPWFGICGLVLSRYVDDEKERGYHRLEQVAERRGLSFKAHDAVEDAMVTARLLNILLAQASKKWGSRFMHIRDYWSFQRQHGIMQERGIRNNRNKRGRVWEWTDW